MPKIPTVSLALVWGVMSLVSFAGCGGSAGDIAVSDVTKEQLPPPPAPPKPGSPGTAPPKGGGSPSNLPDTYTR